MAEHFTIHCDSASGLITMKLSGFWNVAMVDRFAPEWRASVRTIKAGSRYRCLCDLSDYQTQSQEVAAAFAALLEDDELAADRVALVAVSALTGMQVKRVSGPRKTRVFNNVDAASNWLKLDTE